MSSYWDIFSEGGARRKSRREPAAPTPLLETPTGKDVLGVESKRKGKARALADLEKQMATVAPWAQRYITRPVGAALTYIPKLEAQLVSPTPGPWYKEFTEAAKPGAPMIGEVITKRWKPKSFAGRVGKGILSLGADIGLDPTSYIGVGAVKALGKGGQLTKAGRALRKVEYGRAKSIAKAAVTRGGQGASAHTKKATEWIASKAIKSQAMPTRAIQGVAKTLADERFLEQVAEAAITARVPKTALTYGIGKYRATLVGPQALARTKEAMLQPLRAAVQRRPILGAPSRMFSPSYVTPGVLSPERTRRAYETVRFAETKSAEAGRSLAHSINQLEKQYNITPQESEVLTSLHRYYTPFQKDRATYVEALTNPRIGERSRRQLKELVRKLDALEEGGAERILADIPVERHELLNRLARDVIPSIYAQVRKSEMLPKLSKRLFAALEDTRGGAANRGRLESFMGAMQAGKVKMSQKAILPFLRSLGIRAQVAKPIVRDIIKAAKPETIRPPIRAEAIRMLAPSQGTGEVAARIESGELKTLAQVQEAMAGKGIYKKDIQAAMREVRVGAKPTVIPGKVSAEPLGALLPTPERLHAIAAAKFKTLKPEQIKELAKQPNFQIRQRVADLALQEFEKGKAGVREWYLPGTPGEGGFPRRGAGPVGFRVPPSELAKTIQHPFDRAVMGEALEALGNEKLSRATTRAEASAAYTMIADGKKLRPERNIMVSMYTRITEKALSDMRAETFAKLKSFALPAKEGKNLPGYRQANWDELKGKWVPNEVFDVISKIYAPGKGNLFKPEELQGAMKGLYQVNQWFKAMYVAGPTAGPRWIILNTLGNYWTMFLAGGKVQDVLRGTAAVALKPGNPDIEVALAAHGMASQMAPILKRAAQATIRTVEGKKTLAEVTKRLGDEGVLSGFATGERLQRKATGKFAKWNLLSPKNALSQFYVNFNEMIEESFKAGLAIRKLEEGMSFREAANYTNRFFISYGEITQFEKKFKAFGAPFWTWLSRNFRIQIENAIMQPWKAGAYVKGKEEMEAVSEPYPRELKPEWLERAQGVRVPVPGKPRYVLSRLPVGEVSGYLQPSQIVQMLAPTLQVPLQAAFRADPFTGQKVTVGKSIMRALPGVSQAGRYYEQPPERRPGWLLGALTGYREYPLNLEREAIRYRQKQMDKLRAIRKRLEKKKLLPKTKQKIAAEKRGEALARQMGVPESMLGPD